MKSWWMTNPKIFMKTDEFLNFSSEFADFSVDGGVTKGSDASGCEIAAIVRPGRKRVIQERTVFFSKSGIVGCWEDFCNPHCVMCFEVRRCRLPSIPAFFSDAQTNRPLWSQLASG